MKGFSSALSISAHVAIGAAVLFGTTKTAQTDPGRPRVDSIIFAALPQPHDHDGVTGGIAGPIATPSPLDLSRIPTALPLSQTGSLIQSLSPEYHPLAGGTAFGQSGSGDGGITESRAEVVTSPLPIYPDLLRQAGVQGRVVLEAIVDTTGRVLATSIQVVSATHPGFVAPARQALLASLFRPAMVGGQPIRMRVRIPYEFAIRGGTGRAR